MKISKYSAKYLDIFYLTVLSLMLCCSIFNFRLSSSIVRYIGYAIYLLIFISSLPHMRNRQNARTAYIGGIIIILVLYTMKDYVVLGSVPIYLYYLLGQIKKFRWVYIVFTAIILTMLCLSLILSIFFGSLSSKVVEVCDASPSGDKILSRNVYDAGAAGYSLSYYITEKYGLFERTYLVASRGRKNDAEYNVFIDENTLEIQGIIYDISGSEVVFRQGGTEIEMRRKKRKNIFFIF